MIEAPEDWVLSLGMVVWGCVRGHPWWPARISMNEKERNWYRETNGKVWVAFFNDASCAWLKRSEIRPFDSYFRDACLKLNSTKRKFVKYEPAITMSIALAEEYIRLLPEGGLSDNEKITPQGTEVLKLRLKTTGMDGAMGNPPRENGREGGVGRKSRGSGRRVGRPKKSVEGRKTKENGMKPNDVYAAVARDLFGGGFDSLKRKDPPPSSSAEDFDTDTGGNESNGRSKRKRRRPARLEDGFVVDKKLMEQGVIPYPSSKGGEKSAPPSWYHSENVSKLAQDSSNKKSRETTPTLRLPRQRARRLNVPRAKSAEERAKTRKSSAKSPSPRGSSDGLLGNRPTNQRPTSLPTFVGGRNHNQRRKLIDDVAKTANFSKHLQTLDGTLDEGTQLGANDGLQSLRISKTLKKQLLAAREKQRALDNEATESDDNAGDDHILCNKSAIPGAVQAYAQGTSQAQIQQILKRVSKLEEDCRSLKLKAASEEQTKLGEDATAAGLKNAVMALSSAAATFSRKRGHKIDVLGRAVDLLWSDQEQNVSADISLLRSVTKSLVFAEAKRGSIKEVMRQSPEIETPAQEINVPPARADTKSPLPKGHINRVQQNANTDALPPKADINTQAPNADTDTPSPKADTETPSPTYEYSSLDNSPRLFSSESSPGERPESDVTIDSL